MVLSNSTGAIGIPRKSSWRLEMRQYIQYILQKASLAQPTLMLKRSEGLENCESFLPDSDIASGEVEGERERRCVFS